MQSAEEGERRLFLPSIRTFSKRRSEPADVPVLVHLLELNLRSILQTDGEEDKLGQEQSTLWAPQNPELPPAISSGSVNISKGD